MTDKTDALLALQDAVLSVIPGGYSCDPQQVADDVREVFEQTLAEQPLRNMKDGATFEEYRDQLAVGNLTPVDQMAFDNRLHEALAEQPAGAVCPDCAAAVLYECPACSATNYPDRPDAIGSDIGELRRVLRMVFDAYRDNEARLPPLVAGCVEGALIGSDSTTPPAASVDVDTGNYVSDPLYKALDALYERGWTDLHQKRKFDARGTNEWGAVLDFFRAIKGIALIDSAGGAKGETVRSALCRMRGELIVKKFPPEQINESELVDISALDAALEVIEMYEFRGTPQPDGGDEAVAWRWSHPDGDSGDWRGREPDYEQRMRDEQGCAIEYAYTRPSAAAAVPEGFVLVPRVPAEEMRRIGTAHHANPAALARDIYVAMLAAAPAAPKGGVVALTLGQRAVAAELLRCCESWEPGVRIMGNVKASDAADLLRSLLPAPKLDDLATPRAEQDSCMDRLVPCACMTKDQRRLCVNRNKCSRIMPQSSAEQGGREVGNG